MWRAIPATGSRPRSSATPSRFTLSFRDVEDLLAQRGITVSTSPSGTGARLSVWPTHGGAGGAQGQSATRGIWTNSS